jgi:hypothetical protein
MKKIIAPLFISASFFSCSFGEVKSSENYIEKFTITPAQIFVKHDQNLIQVLTFQENQDTLSNIKPEIIISENATLSKSGENWTTKDFFYIVVAENGDKREYSVQITIAYNKYDFEKWDLSNGTNGYYIPATPNSIWASGNAGISMALSILKRDSENPESYPTRKTSDGYNGSTAVVMETIEGGTVFGRKVPLFSGNFFLGNFNISKAITDELAATEVGSIYPAKPKNVKGWYKYEEGPGDFSNDGTPEPGRRDSCNAHVSFYQGDSPSSGKDTTLTVKNIDDSELVIAEAEMKDCSETLGDDFHKFTLPLEYKKEPDFQNHYYKLAISFAASRNGAKYAGKIGSKLIVDEVEIEDY